MVRSVSGAGKSEQTPKPIKPKKKVIPPKIKKLNPKTASEFLSEQLPKLLAIIAKLSK